MNSVFLSATFLLAAPLTPAAAWETSGDASVLLQSSLQGQPGDERPLKHTLRCARGSTSGVPYLVDGGADARGKGVGYYFTKSTKDRDLRTLAHWGTVVTGTDAGDGWLQVGECYLPMTVEGKQVVKPVQHKPEAPAKKPESRPAQLAPAAPPAAPAAARPTAAVRPAAPKAKAAVPVAQPQHYTPGEAVEMLSPKTKRYFASVITGKGSVANTYNLRMPTAPEDYSKAADVPLSALRRPPNITESQMGATFAIGETAEFKVSTATSWLTCIIQDRGRLPKTYTVYVSPGQPGHGNRTLTDIPAAWLRRVAGSPQTPRGVPVDSDVATALQRLHASYEEIKGLLEREERQGS